ncbi:MAG: hypothetical protein KGI80_01910 [Verrucomicrobiota bacterium]|nr:hypothetical protein [Verrucomicrobiota bacterium]
MTIELNNYYRPVLPEAISWAQTTKGQKSVAQLIDRVCTFCNEIFRTLHLGASSYATYLSGKFKPMLAIGTVPGAIKDLNEVLHPEAIPEKDQKRWKEKYWVTVADVIGSFAGVILLITPTAAAPLPLKLLQGVAGVAGLFSLTDRVSSIFVNLWRGNVWNAEKDGKYSEQQIRDTLFCDSVSLVQNFADGINSVSALSSLTRNVPIVSKLTSATLALVSTICSISVALFEKQLPEEGKRIESFSKTHIA